jgi:hypothetical protein
MYPHHLRNTVALTIVLAAFGCAAVPETRCGPGEERSVNDLMYFGTSKSVGVVTSEVTPEEWSEFLRTSVTPRFPQGLTVWQASGQWRTADGAIAHETTFVLNLVHPDDARSEAALGEISAEYKSHFNQEAVLRVKSHACASF